MGAHVDGRLRVIAVPHDDREFARVVQETTAKLDGNGQRSPVVIECLLDELRGAYPKLEIHHQHQLAAFEDEPRTWYAYRDGRATAPAEPADS